MGRSHVSRFLAAITLENTVSHERNYFDISFIFLGALHEGRISPVDDSRGNFRIFILCDTQSISCYDVARFVEYVPVGTGFDTMILLYYNNTFVSCS